MPDLSFRPASGRFGIQPVITFVHLPVNPFTASATQLHMAGSPGGRSYLLRAYVFNEVNGGSAGGSLNVRVFKRRASDDTRVQLTSDFNIETLTAREKTALAFVGTLIAGDRYFVTADIAEIDCVSDAAIETQPLEVVVVLEFALLN